MFLSRSRLQRLLDQIATDVAMGRRSADRAEEATRLLSEAHSIERAESSTRKWAAIVLGLTLAGVAGVVSINLLLGTIASLPIGEDPGRIGVVLADDEADARLQVDTVFDASVAGSNYFTIDIHVLPGPQSTAPVTTVGLFFCGSVRNNMRVSEVDEDRVLHPLKTADVTSQVGTDSRLEYLDDCEYVAVATRRDQLRLHGVSQHPIAIEQGKNFVSLLPGVTTPAVDVDVNGSMTHPLPRGTPVRVSLVGLPVDLSVVTSAPQVPADGQLDWTTTAGSDSTYPIEYRIAGTLANRENEAQITVFTAGALVGLAGAALLWALEAAVELASERRRRRRFSRP